jgi:tetratricopeptide (TPR) repeat protein
LDENAEKEHVGQTPDAAGTGESGSKTHTLASHRTHNVGLLFGALGVLGSLALKWVDAPLGKDPRALSFPFMQPLPTMALHPQLISYGAIAIILLGVGLIVYFLQARWLRWIAIGLLALGLLAPLQLAFTNPNSLRRLTSEFHQYARIRSFTAAYLPVNKGREPELWPSLPTETIWDRFSAGWYFLALGWFVFLYGSVLIFVFSVLRMPSGKGRACLELASVLIALSSYFLFRPAFGQLELRRAYLSQARGENEKAVQHSYKAIAWDRWYTLGPEVFDRIGQLHDRMGHGGTPEDHLYQAHLLEQRDQEQLAVFEYQRAAQEKGPIARVAHQEAARTLIDNGLQLYRQRAVGSAVAQWEQALQEDPLQVQAYFYLTRAYFELAQYRHSVETGQQFIRRVSNVFVVANVYSNLGDSYTQLREFTEAREAYALSYKLDATMNNRALRALVGD